MIQRKRFKLITRLISTASISLWFLAIILMATACSTGLGPANAPAPAGDDAIQIPEQTQFYVDVSRATLASELGISPEQIELESVTEPATMDGKYIVKLVVGGITYEYHGRNREIQLIFISEPDPAIITPTAESTAATENPSPPSEATVQSTAVAATCTDAATFIADITIPDNLRLAPNTGFVKTWRVQNSGTCTWSDHYQLIHSGGHLLGAVNNSMALPTSVAPGQNVDLSINMVAPAAEGTYRSDWHLTNSQGIRFGVGTGNAPLWVKLDVSWPQPVNQGSIAGFAWQDQDFDNQVEADEMLANVLITLSVGANCGTALEAVNTDENGRFHFSNLAAGSYCLTGTDGTVTVSQSDLVLNENQSLTDINVTWPPIWPEPATISGWVWHDACAVHNGDDGEAVIDGHCVDDGNGGYVADGMIQPEETYIAGVTVKLRAGSCVGDSLSDQVITTTNIDGQYSFGQLQPGTYCVFIDVAEANNVTILNSGNWTFPAYTVGHHEINLNAGDQAAPVNFGWDTNEVDN